MTLPALTFFERAREAKRRIRQISPEEALMLVDTNVVVLDVREEEEFGRGHIDGAIQIDVASLEEAIVRAVPNETTAILCYCSRGYRAALTADALQRLGYRNVVSIEGGLRAYLEAFQKRAMERADGTIPVSSPAGRQ